MQEIFSLSGSTYANDRNQGKWSHRGGYQLNKSIRGFPNPAMSAFMKVVVLAISDQ